MVLPVLSGFNSHSTGQMGRGSNTGAFTAYHAEHFSARRSLHPRFHAPPQIPSRISAEDRVAVAPEHTPAHGYDQHRAAQSGAERHGPRSVPARMWAYTNARKKPARYARAQSSKCLSISDLATTRFGNKKRLTRAAAFNPSSVPAPQWGGVSGLCPEIVGGGRRHRPNAVIPAKAGIQVGWRSNRALGSPLPRE
jgi:hypothetical protein